MSTTTEKPAKASKPAAVTASGVQSLPVIGKLESPITTYYLLLGATGALVVIGLIMVFSASSVESLLADQASYTVFVRQFAFAVVGGILAPWPAGSTCGGGSGSPSRCSSLSIGLLAAVIPFGKMVNGNRNWLAIGPLQFQPSEFAKLALVLVGALIFANKSARMASTMHVVLPYLVPISTVVLGARARRPRPRHRHGLPRHHRGGARRRRRLQAPLRHRRPPRGRGRRPSWSTRSSNRMGRIADFFDPACQSDPNGMCGQSVHGMYALADGGWWGVGLGASKEKWEWLSEAHNDFIFAIIGEELGLPGTLMILALFAALAWACYRLVSRTQDRFVRIAGTGIMAWLIGQAIINIGAVIGLFPVIGVPLPLVSAGGSSLVTTLLALGILLSFARNEPGCKALLDARPSMLRRSLAVLPSRPLSIASRRRSR